MYKEKYKDKEWLKQMYSQYGAEYIAQICKCSGTTIRRWLNIHGIQKRTAAESNKISRAGKYKVNEKYFENINTPNKAYWLGFIMADGTMREYRPGCYQLCLELEYNDKYIIDKFKEDIEAEQPVLIHKATQYKDKKSHPRARLAITNTKFCSYLLQYGIVPHKTGNEKVPDNIPDEFIKDFIRGFFDGDGSVSYWPPGIGDKIGRFHIGSMSQSILLKIQMILEEKANVKWAKKSFTLKHGYEDFYELYTGNTPNIMRIYDYLYYDNCVCLSRKEEKFKSILNDYKQSKLLMKRYSPIH